MALVNRIKQLEKALAARRRKEESPADRDGCPPWFEPAAWESRQRLGAAERVMIEGGRLPAGLTPEEGELALGCFGVLLEFCLTAGEGGEGWGADLAELEEYSAERLRVCREAVAAFLAGGAGTAPSPADTDTEEG
jgi:hypothetical protein